MTLIRFESEERMYRSGDLAFVAGTVHEENGTRYMMADVIVYDIEIYRGNFEFVRTAKRCILFLIVSASMILFLLHVPVGSAGNRIVIDDAHGAQPGAVPGMDGARHPLPAPKGEHGPSSTDGGAGSVSGSSVSRKVPHGPRYCPLPPGTPRNMIGPLRSITVILGIVLVIVTTAAMLLLVLWNLDLHGIHSSRPPGLPADATERAEIIFYLQALPIYFVTAFLASFHLYANHAGVIRFSTEGLFYRYGLSEPEFIPWAEVDAVSTRFFTMTLRATDGDTIPIISIGRGMKGMKGRVRGMIEPRDEGALPPPETPIEDRDPVRE